MLSAKTARTQGISRDEWEKAEVVQEFVSKADLRYDIIEHIAAWVWTFRRR